MTTSGTTFGPDALVTLNATVTGSVANTVPTGSVAFVIGSVEYSATLDSTGKGSALVGAKALSGPTAVYALYQGDKVYAQSSSAPVTLSANNGDYTLVASNANIAASSGTSGSTTLTIAQIANVATGGLTGPVAFTCTPSTAAITCSFNPASLTLLANGAQSSTVLTVNTQIPATAANQPQHTGPFGTELAGGGIAIAAIFLLFPLKRRSMARLLLLALAAGITLGTVACGGNGTPPGQKYSNATPGTYHVLVMPT